MNRLIRKFKLKKYVFLPLNEQILSKEPFLLLRDKVNTRKALKNYFSQTSNRDNLITFCLLQVLGKKQELAQEAV